MADEAMADEAMADDEMTDDEMTDDEMSDEAMSDDDMSDDGMSDEAMSDDDMSDDEMTDGHPATTFVVNITNSSSATELETPLAPGVYVVHTTMDTLFVDGAADRGEGLEALAEDGEPSDLAASLGSQSTVAATGTFANPDAAAEAGLALPGQSYSFSFDAVPGDYLSFATMFVQSNDWFYAPAPSGINLFDGDVPLDGDISELVFLWDAGTEIDETPGEGPNQAPRQDGPNTGDDQGAPISAVSGYEGGVTVTISVEQ